MTKRKQKQDQASGLIARLKGGLRTDGLTVEEFDHLIERLQDLADEALPRLLDLLASPEKEDREAALLLLQELDDHRAVRHLRRALLNSDHDEDEKIGIIRVLDALGEPIDEGTFKRVFPDPEALMKRMMTTVLEAIQAPDQVDAFLLATAEQPPEMQAQYVRDILGSMHDRRLLPLFGSLLHSEHDAVVMAAIDAIEQLKEPATIPLLKERAEYDPSPLVRHAAENAALRLEVRLVGQSSHPWETPSEGPVVHCMLSTMDGAGGQVVFLAREQQDGSCRLLDVMFNDHEGIKESFSIIADETDLEDMMDTFEACDFADVSLERCRAEVNRAYQVTLEAHRRLPPSFVVWKDMLEGKDLRTVEEIPLPTLEPSHQADLLADCGELMILVEFGFWFFNPEDVEAFAPRYLQLKSRGENRMGTGAAYDALLAEAIEAVVDDTYRRLLIERLRRQAWLLAQVYEDEEMPLWALAAASAIEDGVIVEHPLLREMMDLSLLNATL